MDAKEEKKKIREENNETIEKSDNELFLKEFNKRGYFLEDAVYTILSNGSNIGISRNYVARRWMDLYDERIEYDTLLEIADKVFVVEAKRTDDDWIFAATHDKPKNIVNAVYKKGRKNFIIKPLRITEGKIDIVHHDFIVKMNEDKKMVRKSKNSLQLPSKRHIHKAVRQVLKQTKAIMMENSKYSSEGIFFIPVIVTNARLFCLDYDPEKIKTNGDLKEMKELKQVGAVAFNFSEYFGINTHPDLGSSETEGIVKTVFVINIDYLKKGIGYLSGFHL